MMAWSWATIQNFRMSHPELDDIEENPITIIMKGEFILMNEMPV